MQVQVPFDAGRWPAIMRCMQARGARWLILMMHLEEHASCHGAAVCGCACMHRLKQCRVVTCTAWACITVAVYDEEAVRMRYTGRYTC